MTISKDTGVAIAEGLTYVVLLPFVFYLLVKHGRHGILGYIYLLLFFALRIVGSIITYHDRHDPTPTTAAAIVDSIGLSPLLLTLGGFYDESHHYIYQGRHKVRSFILSAAIHLVTVNAAILVALSASHLAKTNPGPTPSEIKSSHHKQEAGAFVFLLVWLVLVAQGIHLLRQRFQARDSRVGLLLGYTVAATAVVAVRVCYTIVYSFDHSSKLNPITGTFGIKLVLIFIGQLLAVVVLLVAGFMSRHLASGHKE